MRIYGISEGFHDASLSVIEDGKILFAAHSERYSKEKNDPSINKELFNEALSFGKPDAIAYYEKQWKKKLRLKVFGGRPDIPKQIIYPAKVYSFDHHYSHAAAGYYTSPFTDAVIVVLDAIGEFTTASVWTGKHETILPMYKKNYPFSFGLFYSAFTSLIGLKPNQEEYIMMGMASYGNPEKYFNKINNYFPSIRYQKNNFHKGIPDWDSEDAKKNAFDIAAAVQVVFENRLVEFMKEAKQYTGKNNLVFMGGTALNCSANTRLWEIFDDIWIMPNPGDAGSSLGAAAALYGKHIDWDSPYLGTEIPGEYPVDQILNKLLKEKIAPVASGKAEFGPRALGNRSILADPRDPNIKNLVNKIKQRENFRPFAPVILEEYASEWFDMDFNSPYMQYAVKCKKPDQIPSVVHADGTSRVQTVNRKQHNGLYDLLIKWNDITGIPVLLNTSLNIKGQPMVNDEIDILDWQEYYGNSICY